MTPKEYKFNNHTIRVINNQHGELEFCAKDIVDLLGFADGKKAIVAHCKSKYQLPKYSIWIGSEYRNMVFLNRNNIDLLVKAAKRKTRKTFTQFDELETFLNNLPMDTIALIPSTKTNQTMSSREIAELTGKDHRNVLRDCDILNENYNKLSLLRIEQCEYKADNGQKYREYRLSRMQTFDLMTGYNTELRIKVNRRWEELEQKQRNPSRKELAQWVIELEEQNERQTVLIRQQHDEIKELAPKAELMDVVLDSDRLIDIGQAAKILELPYGRNKLFQKLRSLGILFKNKNEPKQQYVTQGYFKLKEKKVHRDNHQDLIVIKVLVTQKGLKFIAEKLNVIIPPKQLRFID